ncbi:hypothetical protein KC678_00690, partial [Candidatus Dojkabacteria bacterium]|nr:hypothetical protein [Candidatus Dojkabacteria bacterium]
IIKSKYRRPNYYAFNLLPKQSEAEIRILEERDDTILYAFVLVFAGIFIFLILNLIRSVAVKARADYVQGQIDKVQEQIDTYDAVIATHGEIFQKSNLLIEPLTKDIALSRLLEISSLMTEDEGKIVSYGKLLTGGYTLTVEVNEYDNALHILGRAKSIDEVSRPYLTNLAVDPTNEKIKATITFNIIQDQTNIQ